MENHPIPQDVTGFQFKLIGNMTVKQFAYLATGVVFGWILLQLPVNILIKFPFAAFSALLGIGLAYFPISGRPMDTMIGNYIKALIRPTQFIYEKVGGQIYFPSRAPLIITRSTRQYKNDFTPFPKDKLKAYLESLDAQPKNKVDEKESNFMKSVSSLATGSSAYQPTDAPRLNLSQTDLSNPILTNYSPKPLAKEKPTVLATPPTAAMQPASVLPTIKPTPQPQAPIAQTTAKTEPKIAEQTSAARPILKGFNAVGMPSAPDFPNLITGIAKDARGNALPNILVEVRDKEGNPVRAFKTNEVGRFASATPLTNGTYTLEFEDPKAQNRFEKLTINVVGQIIMPVAAISVDTREELRRSLFSTGTQAN